ncbi:MAG: nucleoside hydrolase [Thermomicrobiales bacterium]
MPTHRIHLDTDLGGDIDDLCALALLLRWPSEEPVELTGTTVIGDTDGQRTGMVWQALAIAGHEDIPVAAGADTSGGWYPYPLGLPDATRYWPEPVMPAPNPPDDSVALLKRSIDLGATVIVIGPLTNLRLLEDAHPGALARAPYVQMGGFARWSPPRPGYPAWGNADDFNVQVDVVSAHRVLNAAAQGKTPPILVPLSVTVETALRRRDLGQLHAGDALARLIARQAEAFAADERLAETLCPAAPALPPDLVNFQHDGLAVAIALGWRDGVTIERMPLAFAIEDGLVVAHIDPEGGRRFDVVTAIDGPAFDRFWLDAVAGSAPRIP